MCSAVVQRWRLRARTTHRRTSKGGGVTLRADLERIPLPQLRAHTRLLSAPCGGRDTQRFQRHAREARLPVLRFHDLRHTHATLGLVADVHPKVMQERPGHASVAFTLDIYSHAIPTMQGEAASKVAALLDRPG